MKPLLSQEERDELRQMLEEVCTQAKGTGERAELLRKKLLDAEQAHRPMANEVLMQAELVGLAKLVTGHVKSARTVTMTTSGGSKVLKSLVAGIRRKRSDGSIEFQQTFLAEFTWDEIADALATVEGHLAGNSIRRKLLRRAADLRAQVPEARTVGEALTVVGMSIEDWLAAA